MTFDLEQASLLGILSAALHWLVARSRIAKPIWSRAKGLTNDLLRCPACSGFWLGLGLGAVGIAPMTTGIYPLDVGSAGVLAMFLTPVAEGVMVWGLAMSAVEEDAPDEPIHPPR